MRNKTKYNGVIRWGIIGCGNVTEVKSGPAYKLVNGFQLTAVMRRDFEKLTDYAKRHNIDKYYTNAEELINNNEIDAVYIATPPDTHMYYALKVAAAEKPCCIEKPLSPSYEDSLTIYNSFKNKHIPLFVAYYRRSLPRFDQVKTWLKDKDIGKVRHISWFLSRAPNDQDLSRAYNWRTDPKIATGGYFDDLASHGLDLFTFLLGDINQVTGLSHNQQQLYLAKDAISACWIHESGVTGTGSWNFGCNNIEDRVEIFGSKGKIEFSVFEEKALILETNNKQQEIFIENPKNIQLHHIENMKKELLDGNYIHPSNGYTATHTSWIMDKILGKI
jgi:predicted dehydrogenase